MFNRLKVFVILLLAFSSLSINHKEVEAATLLGNGLYLKNGVTIEIDGKKVIFNDPILNKSGHLLLPMRDFYEAIGATVTWSKQAQTASAKRNGKTVDLTINSKTAQVNGKKVQVSVPPLLYKYRTYIPLRFVSENLDGKVIWNQQAQKVEITLHPPSEGGNTTTPQPDPFVLHINNKRIIMSEPVKIRDGRTYIPAKYFYEHLENTAGNWVTDNDFELQIAGLNFVFTNGSNKILVNQEPVMIEEVPFIESGNMYVPVHFVVNALGGNLRLISSKNEMYIYLYHFMFISDFVEKSQGTTNRPNLVPNAILEGNRSLLVSDNPETLTSTLVPGATETLAEHKVNDVETANKHRVFGWHLNRLGQKVRIGITVQNNSETNSIKITSSKGYSRTSGNSWINYDIGLPMADLVLNGQLKNSDSTGIMINPGETKVIEGYELHAGYVIGFLQDLDISWLNGESGDYTIRTVIAKNEADLTEIHNEPLPIDRNAAHPRGAWPSSAILAELPEYIIGSPEVGYNISNRFTDHLLTEETSLSKVNGSVGNPGHFGMVYKVNIPIANPAGEAKVVKLKLAGRGGLYSGAIKINGNVHLIPTLKAGTEFVQLPDQMITGERGTISIEVMHAGGASLPVAIYLESN